MDFLRSLFGSREQPAPTPQPAEPEHQLLDSEVNAKLLEAATESTNAELQRLETGFLETLKRQLASLSKHLSEFPDGLPAELVAKDLEYFAEHLAKACRKTGDQLVALTHEGSNVWHTFAAAYDSADNYAYLIRTQLVRGCDAIYRRGFEICLAMYPQLSTATSPDLPWVSARESLFNESYKELQDFLNGANSQTKRTNAAVTVLRAKIENAVWVRTSLFAELFFPVFRKELNGPRDSVDWRNHDGVRGAINRDYVKSVIPKSRDDVKYAEMENLAAAYLVFQSNVETAEEDLAAEFRTRFLAEFPYAGVDADLDQRVQNLVTVTVERGFNELLEEALRQTRERADHILERP